MHRAEAAEEHVGDGAVHGLAHQHREDEAGEAVQRAGDDEDVVAEDEAGGGGGQAGVGVQQRHDHRHVRRADGDDQHDAEDEGRGRAWCRRLRWRSGLRPEVDEAADHAGDDSRLRKFWPRNWTGLAADDALQLAGGDERAGGGERAEHDFKAQRAARDGAEVVAVMRNSPMPTRAAASAPKAWESAVRCGMAVMGTEMAIHAPMMEPIARPAMIQSR